MILKNKNENFNENEKEFLNKDKDDEMEIYGYQEYLPYKIATWTCIVLSLGFLRLICHWWPQLMLYSTHKRCSLEKATKLLIIDTYNGQFKSIFVKEIKSLTSNCDNDFDDDIDNSDNFQVYLEDGTSKELNINEIRTVKVKKLLYVWLEDERKFMKLIGMDKGLTKKQFHNVTPLSKNQQNMRRLIYGFNNIKVPLQSISTLVVLEALNPFYIYQAFCVILWSSDYYYYYSMAIVIMSVAGISSAVLQTHRNQKNLNKKVETEDFIKVKRKGNVIDEIITSELVPGDIIVIPEQGCTMTCDAILINGSCIVNESMLTGESVPLLKTRIQNDDAKYIENDNVSHTLYSGTHIIQTRYNANELVEAVVIRTGFLTIKGSLVRSILYPPPADFKFDRGTYKFMWILGFIGILGLIYTIALKMETFNASVVAVKSLNLMSTIIPAALPAVMTIGKIYALSRLKEQKISCINPRIINVSGSLDCVCFDKTGTLTEDGLDLWGVVPITPDKIDLACQNPTYLEYGPLFYGMASCHSLTVVNGEISGDPLEVKMFLSTNWTFEEPSESISSENTFSNCPKVYPSNNQDKIEITIIHQNQFSSKLQRMSVITRKKGSDDYVIYCKGSPESIISLSSLVPSNILNSLNEYTEQGYRVIALGWKLLNNGDNINLGTITREEIESDLTIAGLIVFENKIKPFTIPTIADLKQAKFKIIMLTGDNILTAISVARECDIISADESVVEINIKDGKLHYNSSNVISSLLRRASSLKTELLKRNSLDIEKGDSKKYKIVMNGMTWNFIRNHYPGMIPKILQFSAVFARMSSEQKKQVIVDLQQLGYSVVMCGDGANDCGALKAAHVGISLSDAESSVAAPLTSNIQNISCVTTVLREGRAALTTSFGIFKFMVTYSSMEFVSTMILYIFKLNITDFEFLFIDAFIILNSAFFFGQTKASKGPLVPEKPLTSVFSFIPAIAILLQITLHTIFQLLSLYLIHLFPWFKPFHYTKDHYYKSYENYAVYAISQFQYIGMAIIYSEGAPFREAVWKNRKLLIDSIILAIICIYITCIPAKWLIDLLELQVPPTLEFPVIVLVMAFLNFIIALFLEKVIVEYLLFKQCYNQRRNRTNINNIYDAFIENCRQKRTQANDLSCKNSVGIMNNSFDGSLLEEK